MIATLCVQDNHDCQDWQKPPDSIEFFDPTPYSSRCADPARPCTFPPPRSASERSSSTSSLESTHVYDFDILVIGSGAAGLSVALQTAGFARVAVLSKGMVNQGATYWAQGGIAAVLDDNDSVDAHIADTLDAGAGLCHVDMVRHIVEHSQAAIQWLVEQGVPFTVLTPEEAGVGAASQPLNRDNLKPLHLTQEGGHSHRRIIHATDATGRAIFETLLRRVQENPGISLFENRLAVDLIMQETPGQAGKSCAGAYVYNATSGDVEVFKARFVILASGGVSKAYLFSTNPESATGDGIAMAWRAG